MPMAVILPLATEDEERNEKQNYKFKFNFFADILKHSLSGKQSES